MELATEIAFQANNWLLSLRHYNRKWLFQQWMLWMKEYQQISKNSHQKLKQCALPQWQAEGIRPITQFSQSRKGILEF